MRWLLLVAAVVGCGDSGVSWTGTYSGNMSGVRSCTDGTSQTADFYTVWSIIQNGGELTITSGSCDPQFASLTTSTRASMQPKSCPTTMPQPGIQERVSLNGGTLVWGNDVVTAALSTNYHYTFPDSSTHSCVANINGTLVGE